MTIPEATASPAPIGFIKGRGSGRVIVKVVIGAIPALSRSCIDETCPEVLSGKRVACPFITSGMRRAG